MLECYLMVLDVLDELLPYVLRVLDVLDGLPYGLRVLDGLKLE
jgi:hypothetical protein